MAAGELVKSDFSEILTNLGRKFDIIHAKWSEEKHFEAKFRTQIRRNNDDFNALCDEWVDLFSNATSTVWVKKISNTGPKIRFRKQYQCWPQVGKDVQKEMLFDARRCKATLDMKVLTDNPLTRRKNKHIRIGLNVVVKINFIHLHKVDITRSFSFFIHTCEPQPEPPKRLIQQDNDKLSQRVAEMVQKGMNASPKVVSLNASTLNKISKPKVLEQSKRIQQQQPQPPVQQQQPLQQQLHPTDQLLQHMPLLNMEAVAINQVIPIQSAPELKFQMQPQLTQVVMTAPQLDIPEPLLMCQPTLMFDPTQVIPVTAHHIPHHFVQVHSHNITNQHGHYL